MPQFLPDQGVITRTKQEEVSLLSPSRSQWNWILIRPCSSVQISSPLLPTTVAVCRPCTSGQGVTSGARN